MTDNLQRTIELHYELFVRDNHSMDALAFNKAEYNLIMAIRSLGDYVDCSIKVNVEAKSEGSIIDILQVVISNSKFQHIADVLLGALISNWFRPKIHKTEEIKNRLEIIDKIKSGNYTQQEAECLLADDKKLKKWCSNYYKSLQETKEVSQVTASILSDEGTVDKKTIEQKDFDNKIITTEEHSKTTIIEGTTIHIVSPILVKVNKKQSWEGIYSGKPIDFKVEDTDFLNQVYNHEIKFGNGTYITCSLAITTVTKTKDDGEVEINHNYIVKEVSMWADDDNFQYYTKRYKRKLAKKNAPKQLDLFQDMDFA